MGSLFAHVRSLRLVATDLHKHVGPQEPGGTLYAAVEYQMRNGTAICTEDDMGRVLTFEIPDEIYAALEQMAAKAGVATEAYVLDYLSRRAPVRQRHWSEEERQEAQRRFEQYIGSVDLGRPTGINNEGIDRDLAQEYGNTHENGA